MAVQTRPQVGPASTSAGRDWLRLPRRLSRHPWVITAVLAMRLIIQFIGQAVGVMLLRRRWPPERLPFKMWLYPLPALLTIVGWLWLFSRTGSAIWWGVLVIVLGLVVFFVQARVRMEWPFGAPNSEVVE